jgi:hypothetical protein
MLSSQQGVVPCLESTRKFRAAYGRVQMDPQLGMAPARLERRPRIGQPLDVETKVPSVLQACFRVAAKASIPRYRAIIRQNEISQVEINVVTNLLCRIPFNTNGFNFGQTKLLLRCQLISLVQEEARTWAH